MQSGQESQELLKEVFRLRVSRIIALRTSGSLPWIRETGARPRMIEQVQTGLLPLLPSWDKVDSAMNQEFLTAIIDWAFTLPEFAYAVRDAFRVKNDADLAPLRVSVEIFIKGWISGKRFIELANDLQLTVNELIGVYSSLIAFSFQTIVEQGISLLGKILEAQQQELAPAAIEFPEFLRFGVPSMTARILCSEGLRHRRAALRLGEAISSDVEDSRFICLAANEGLLGNADAWRNDLGALIYENTLVDLQTILNN